MPTRLRLADLLELEGEEVGVSEWHAVSEDDFALLFEAIGYRLQSLRSELALHGPFGAGRHPGHLALLLLPPLLAEAVTLVDQRTAAALQVDNLRFLNPIGPGDRVRARASMLHAHRPEPDNPGLLIYALGVTLERDPPSVSPEALTGDFQFMAFAS